MENMNTQQETTEDAVAALEARLAGLGGDCSKKLTEGDEVQASSPSFTTTPSPFSPEMINATEEGKNALLVGEITKKTIGKNTIMK
jgi:hypothetical protein